jgi:hypothetical protein
VEGVSVGGAAGRNPGLAAAAFNGAGGAARPWHGRPAGTPAVPPFYSGCAPSWRHREERRGKRVPDRRQHVVRGAGNAAWSGPAVLVTWPTGEGRRHTWQGGLQGASECSWLWEGAASGRCGRARTPRRRYGAQRAWADRSGCDVVFQRDMLRCSLV